MSLLMSPEVVEFAAGKLTVYCCVVGVVPISRILLLSESLNSFFSFLLQKMMCYQLRDSVAELLIFFLSMLTDGSCNLGAWFLKVLQISP